MNHNALGNFDMNHGGLEEKMHTGLFSDIRDFGAIGDGKHVCTAAIQATLDFAARENGCGIAVIPRGVWLTGTIIVPSNITMEIAPGALLIGVPDISAYPEYDKNINNPEHHADIQKHHLFVFESIENVIVRGGGAINGNGERFWDPPSTCEFYTARTARPSPLIELRNAKNITIQDITIADSPGWTLHLSRCENVRIRGITIHNNLFGPNTDGIDVTDSRDVFISDCNIVAGDDAVVLKSLGGVCERVLVTNCVMQTRCSAMKLGASESLGTIRQVTMSNCIVRDSSRGISLYCLAGGMFEDITFSNIVLETDNDLALVNPIHIHCSHRPKGDAKGDRGMGKIRNVRVCDILVKSDARIILTNQDGGQLENVFLSNILMEYPQQVENEFALARRAEKGQFSCYCPEARAAQACIVAYNVKGLALKDIVARWPAQNAVPMHFLWARNVEDGFVDCPQGKSTDNDLLDHDVENCTITIR